MNIFEKFRKKSISKIFRCRLQVGCSAASGQILGKLVLSVRKCREYFCMSWDNVETCFQSYADPKTPSDRLYHPLFQIHTVGLTFLKKTVTFERRCVSSFSVMSYAYPHLVCHRARDFVTARYLEPDRTDTRKIFFPWIIL